MSGLRCVLACLLALVAGTAAFARAAEDAPRRPLPETTPALLLVASRQLDDPSFRETVVLVTRHGRGGPLGIVINRPLKVPLDKLFPSVPAAAQHHLHEGGPVERNQLFFVFRSAEAAEATLLVAPQTYVARSPNLLGELLRGTRPHAGLRVFAGYAGWAPGQLENEISRGDWHVLPVDAAALFEMPADAVWQNLYRRATQTSAQFRFEGPVARDGARRTGANPVLSSGAPTLATRSDP